MKPNRARLVPRFIVAFALVGRTAAASTPGPDASDALVGADAAGPALALAYVPQPYDPGAQRRAFSFAPHAGNRCTAFAVTETSVGYIGKEEPSIDGWLVSNDLGLMLNAGRWAVGGSAELHWTHGHLRAGPALRCRRWFAGEQNVEIVAGYLDPGEDWIGTRMVGPTASVRYSPTPDLFFQAGTCRFRETSALYYDTATGRQWSDGREFTRSTVGIGLAGLPGAATWGVELLVGGVVFLGIAVIEGMGWD